MITREFVDTVVKERNWKPYIKEHWIDFTSGKAGVIITFKDHEQYEYKCSYKIASDIIKLYKEGGNK
jgi:hypothetical protein